MGKRLRQKKQSLTKGCPCGGPSFGQCCGPYLRNTASPPTAEALMRSRYTAYVRREVDYLVATHRPTDGQLVDAAAIRDTASNTRWLGLEVLETSRGDIDDHDGEVLFVARYEGGSLRERSYFERQEGRWFYVSGA